MAWVNTQGLFVLGPIVLAFALIDAALRPGSFAKARRPWWRKVGLATFLTGVACLINPYGLSGALYPLELARTMSNPIFSTTIGELTPIPLFIQQVRLLEPPAATATGDDDPGRAELPGPALLDRLGPAHSRVPGQGRGEGAEGRESGQGRGGSRRLDVGQGRQASEEGAGDEPSGGEEPWRLSPFRLLLFVAFSALSWQATRNSHQFAAVVGTVTAWNFGEWAAAIRKRRAPRFEVAPRLVAIALIVLVFAGVASGTFYAMTGEGRVVGLGEEPLWYPHEAVEFAGTPGMPTRYLGYHIGHASLYEYRHGPERKVFADARLEVIGADLFERYEKLKDRIAGNEPGWERELDDMERPLVLVDHDNSGVGATLLTHPRWRCVWFDPIAAIFVHEAYAGVTQSYTVDFAARHFRPEREDDPKGAAALFASAKGVAQLRRRYRAGSRASGPGAADGLAGPRPCAARARDRTRFRRRLEGARPARTEPRRAAGRAVAPVSPPLRPGLRPLLRPRHLRPATGPGGFTRRLQRPRLAGTSLRAARDA